MTTQAPQYDLAGEIIGAAMEVHREIGFGFKESIYQNALVIELAARGFDFEVEKKITVFYKGRVVGDFAADIVVEKKLILELKAFQDIVKAHEVQLLNYLAATNTEEGLLLNFGSSSLQFKKKFRTYKPSSDATSDTNLDLHR